VKYHPFAELFPLIDGQQFEELAANIKANGLREPIWVYKNQILDGRNRYIACEKVGIKVTTQEYIGTDPLGFVLSQNVHRRHLNESQRAMVAAKIANLPKGANQHNEGLPIGASSASLKVGERTVNRARQVIKRGSKELQAAVENGEISVSKAASVVNLPESEQLSAATAPKQSIVEDEPERPDVDEELALAAAEAELAASVDKIMQADDKLAAAYAEITRQASEIAQLKISRDGFISGKDAMTVLVKKEQKKVERLERENKKLRDELESLKERIAIMDVA